MTVTVTLTVGSGVVVGPWHGTRRVCSYGFFFFEAIRLGSVGRHA